MALTGFKALLGTDPSKASGYLDEHRDVLAGLPNYDQMARQAAAYRDRIKELKSKAVINITPGLTVT